jgi:hypothetical protein
MILKPLFKKTVEIICKKNCACACDNMIYRIAKEQGIRIAVLSMKQKDEINEKDDDIKTKRHNSLKQLSNP